MCLHVCGEHSLISMMGHVACSGGLKSTIHPRHISKSSYVRARDADWSETLQVTENRMEEKTSARKYPERLRPFISLPIKLKLGDTRACLGRELRPVENTLKDLVDHYFSLSE
jgi:hypothetical protein